MNSDFQFGKHCQTGESSSSASVVARRRRRRRHHCVCQRNFHAVAAGSQRHLFPSKAARRERRTARARGGEGDVPPPWLGPSSPHVLTRDELLLVPFSNSIWYGRSKEVARSGHGTGGAAWSLEQRRPTDQSPAGPKDSLPSVDLLL
ncbi:hypothetical protein EJB05_00758, partial [Eragrostis curvula]